MCLINVLTKYMQFSRRHVFVFVVSDEPKMNAFNVLGFFFLKNYTRSIHINSPGTAGVIRDSGHTHTHTTAGGGKQ